MHRKVKKSETDVSICDTTAQAYAFNGGLTHTVMWSYFFEHLNCYEFSSDDYHGDATHDNARAIREAKAWVASYV